MQVLTVHPSVSRCEHTLGGSSDSLSCLAEFVGLALLVRLAPKENFLAQHEEVRLMQRKTEHDEIGVETMQHMPLVGVVTRLAALLPEEAHDLVLTLARLVRIRKNDLVVGRGRERIVRWPRFASLRALIPRHAGSRFTRSAM